MRKLVIALVAALSLASCASVSNTFDKLTGSSVSTNAVYVAANTFDALEVTGTNYLRLPKCTGSNGPACRDPAVTAKIVPAIRAGRVARVNLQAFQKANPGALGPSGLYNALVAANSTLQGVYSQYNVGGK